MAKKTQTVIFNMDVEDLKTLIALSIIDKRFVGDLIREAIKKYIKSRRRNPNIKNQIEAERKKRENMYKAMYKAMLTPRKDK